MGDIKKKIIDILFEDEKPIDEEFDADSPLLDIKEKSEKKEVKVPSAKDILYGEQNSTKGTTFIDLYDKPKEKLKAEDEGYEMMGNVSPIFGLQDGSSTKRKTAKELEPRKPINFEDSDLGYTGVVLSPIYGYENSKADGARSEIQEKIDYLVNEEEPFDYEEEEQEDQQELHELEDDDLPVISDDMFEVAVEKYDEEDFNSKDVENAFSKLKEENKNIYDTTPIKLFDIDDNDDNKDMDDLFGEIVGEDK